MVPALRLPALLIATVTFLVPSYLMPATTSSNFPPEMSAELESVMARYADAVPKQHEAMLDTQMDVSYDGRLPKFKEQGKMSAIRTITRVGEMTVKNLNFVGDERIRKQLISRFVEDEQKAHVYDAMAVSPKDYEFKIKAIVVKDADTPKASTTYIFSLKPKRKAPGLFKGELWVDGATGMPLKESGELVKAPSLWLSNIVFERNYDLINGIAVVKHFESSAHIKILGVGRAELNIDFSNFRHASAEPALRDAGL